MYMMDTYAEYFKPLQFKHISCVLRAKKGPNSFWTEIIQKQPVCTTLRHALPVKAGFTSGEILGIVT